MLDWIGRNGAEPITHQLFIDGQWRGAENGASHRVETPVTGEAIAYVGDAGRGDVEAAIAAAVAAQPGWAGLPPAARAGCLYKAAELFEARIDMFVDALIRETGSAQGKARFEASLIPLALREAAGLTTREIGEVYPSQVPGKVNRTLRTPRGVVGVITPWNFPLYLGVRGFVYALALGNAIVLKPAQDTPIVGGLMLAGLLADAGMPPGVFNVLTTGDGGAAMIGAAFTSDPRIASISFTGSTGIGRYLAQDCAKVFKPVMLEMGGKNPLIVLEDADVDQAVNAAFFGAFLHQGQICMSTDRIIVADALHDAFLDKLVAKVSQFVPTAPEDPTCVIGPIINRRQLSRLEALIDDARAAGATVRTGGRSEGAYYLPTILTGVTPNMRVWHEEIFGPAAVVCRAATEAEAIALANDTDYGLSAAIMTGDVARGEALAERLHAGMIHINDSTVHDEPHCPFSGLGHSGGGGKWGPKGAIEAFTEQRWISSMRGRASYPF